MDIETIYNMWEKDGDINITNLSQTTRDIPIIHNKYYKMFAHERLKLKKLKSEYDVLRKLKSEYYRGELDKEELEYLGWKPFNLKVVNSAIPDYLSADSDLIKLSLRIGMIEENIEYLRDIIKQINSRNFQIKNIIDFEKFKHGGY